MAISRKTQGNGVAGSAAFSGSWSAGDFIMLVLENTAAATVPALPSGYTNLASGQDSMNAHAMRVCYKIAAGGDTMPTITDATTVSWAIYGGVDNAAPFVQLAGQAGVSNSMAASGIASYQNSADWVVIVATGKGITGNIGTYPFNSMSLVTEYKSGSDDNVIFDSNTNLSSYSYNAKTIDASISWITKTFELVASSGGTPSNSARSAKITGILEKEYSRKNPASLPSDDTVLATVYDATEITNVATDDGTRVEIFGGAAYLIHQFKDHHTNSTDQISVSWNGQSVVAPTAKTVYLQVYNHNSAAWETVASNSAAAANTDFTLSGTITANLSYYYDSEHRTSFRVYQQVI
jgi:hypothetical protein